MNELVKADSYASAPLESRMHYARALATASLIPYQLKQGDATAANVLLVLETGAMLGLHPIAALQGVNVIEGKPSLSPALMSAVIRRSGHDLRVETKGSVAGGDFSATATLVREDDPDHPFTVTWDIDRAIRAELVDKYELDAKTGKWKVTALRGAKKLPSPWQKYTEAMMKARAISEVSREGGTDSLMGVGYIPEELGAEVDEQGEIIAMPQEQQSQPPVVESAPVKSEPPVTETKSEDDAKAAWRAKIDAAFETRDVEQLRVVYREAGRAGILALGIDDENVLTVETYIMKLVERLNAPEGDESDETSEDVVDAEIVDEGRAAALDD